MDKILREDLEYICANVSEHLKILDCKTVLITGITGLIGSQLAKTLLYFNLTRNAEINIIGTARNEKKAEQVFGDLLNNKFLNILFFEISEKIELENIDYIIHGANTTTSKDYIEKPVEVINSILIGTNNILQIALKNSVKNLVYLSSMEVYGVLDKGEDDVFEEDIGYIDPLKVRSSYPEAKRMAECLCVSYLNEYKVNVTIARLSQTFGAGTDLIDDNRLPSEFARAVINGQNICLNTLGDSMRTMCYTRDAVAALFILLAKGEKGEAYNIANEKTFMTVRDLANIVADKVARGAIKVKFSADNRLESAKKNGYMPSTKLKLSSQKIKNLGWTCNISVEEMFSRTIQSHIERNSK